MVDHTQEQEKVRLALRSLHAELTQTNAALVPLIPIHQANIDTLQSAPLDFEVGVSFRLGGCRRKPGRLHSRPGLSR